MRNARLSAFTIYFVLQQSVIIIKIIFDSMDTELKFSLLYMEYLIAKFTLVVGSGSFGTDGYVYCF